MSDLKIHIAAIEVALNGVDEEAGPRPNWRDGLDVQFDWDKRHRKAIEDMKLDLQERGAKFTNPNGGYAVRLAGVHATSTSGIEGALRNWVTAAHKRLGKAA